MRLYGEAQFKGGATATGSGSPIRRLGLKSYLSNAKVFGAIVEIVS